MFMNQFEIEYAANQSHECPNVCKGIHLLLRFMEAVNQQSDGWAYWRPPIKASQKLVDLLKTAGNLSHGTHGTISAADLRRAITPIKTMVTKQQKIQAKYGNTFSFDVDAALAELTD